MKIMKVFIPHSKNKENFSNIIRIFKRTTGISTTEIVDKIIHIDDPKYKKSKLVENTDIKYYHTINKFRVFANDKPIMPSGKVVFCCGSFDLLNFAHVSFLQKAKSEGNYLIVGLYDDITINELKGHNYPVLDVYSRALNLLALKFVDDIVLNTPYKLTPDFIEEFGIDIIVEGKTSYMRCNDPKIDSLELIRGLAKIKQVDSGVEFGFNDLITRIKDNQKSYADAIERKKQKLSNYYKAKKDTKVDELI